MEKKKKKKKQKGKNLIEFYSFFCWSGAANYNNMLENASW